ncbi:MAG: hypothetical protein ABJA78_15295 [Ferruginibacter sp.]
MNLDFQQNIPADFNNDARVWIYQASRLFLLNEALEIETMLEDFVADWKSHGDVVTGYANLFFGQFIVIMADETATGVSGCSTDSSVRLIKAIQEKFKVAMFDRTTLAFIIKDKLQLLPLNQLKYAVENNFINGDTLYFNNVVAHKKELLEKWIIPVKESWLKTKISNLVSH